MPSLCLKSPPAAEWRASPVRSVVARPFGDHERLARVESALDGLAAGLVTPASGPSADAARALAAYVRRPGKRVRPYLCVLGHELASDTPRDGVATFAAALELLHAFLLVHDDIVDRATTRRGEAALHVVLRPEPSRSLSEAERQRLGADLALVAGDWLYTAALEAMLDADLDPSARHLALREVLAVCRDTARGQYDDVAFAARPLFRVTPDEVLSVYRRKTARYTFEAPLVAGALLGGASASVVESLRSFSDAAGVAFQLVDDLLALFADDDETGKPGLADLREAKKTWPLLTAFEGATALERAWLEELFIRRDAGERDLVRVRSLIRRTGAREAALGEVRRLCDEAQAALASLSSGPGIAELTAIVDWLRKQAGALS